MTANYERAVIDHIIDLYEENNVPVALIEVIPQAACLLIENIAVLPNQQGKGLGDFLRIAVWQDACEVGDAGGNPGHGPKQRIGAVEG